MSKNTPWASTVEELCEVLNTEKIDAGEPSQLLVYNDDFNTFDWVIQCFIEVCGHSFVQSEQLSLLIHFKGKAIVKTGPFQKLKTMREALVDRGLSAVIESLKEKKLTSPLF